MNRDESLRNEIGLFMKEAKERDPNITKEKAIEMFIREKENALEAKKTGEARELSPEELEAVSGGGFFDMLRKIAYDIWDSVF
ncbi:MAG: hypothetical protein K5855_00385 [Oscillospiraceae bacterium]|nr:hypothetical protein [Oscillospiraceae bacterium]